MSSGNLPGSQALKDHVARLLAPLGEGPGAAALATAPGAVARALPLVLAGSDFVAASLARDAQLLPALIEGGDLTRQPAAQDFLLRAPAFPRAGQSVSQDELLAQLRRWRRREMVRIAWRDLAGWADLPETLAGLSAFSDAAVRLAAAHARVPLVAGHGEPRAAGEESIQPLVIIGMGKLGGGELNFSSDIDLVLLFPEGGETDGHRSISNEEFFTRQAQGMVRLLSTPTPEGIVARVDLRLRPFGDSGPLVPSFAFLEDYLPRHGRDWERYAWVKARAIEGIDSYAALEREAVLPFVYRRYLDYGMFESLRELKALIERQVSRRELVDDVKLGPGGIREIELIVQLFQLIRGGQDARLRTPSLRTALAVLGGTQLLPPAVVAELDAAYRHLRRLENRLQMLSDTQTHRLPVEALARERIALAMGAPGWDALMQIHQAHAARVMAHFKAVLGPPRTRAPHAGLDLAGLWEGEVRREDLVPALAAAGFAAGEAGEAAQLLIGLTASGLGRRLTGVARSRLQALLPLVVREAAGRPGALNTLRRVLRILETIGQRSTYFALLVEAPLARARLLDLAASGDFLTTQIAAHPLLLDELIGGHEGLPGSGALREELKARMREAAAQGLDREIEALAQVQRAAVFRVAVADLAGGLPLMAVSDELTRIAEIILAQALEVAWREMTRELGEPMCGAGGVLRPVHLCVVGYGKLGGREMGYGSDLDLVMLHDSEGERQQTSGARALDNSVFFVRLVQRLVHLLTVQTAAGRLYEVDMRLRPSGKGGLLVTAIQAFGRYQREQAWTWEHQALLHARAVAGEAALCERFEALRMEVLCNHVRRDTLRGDVRSMRERMRRELSKAPPGQLDLKQGPGGIADIEFLAQYWALAFAHAHPAVALFSDTIRQLESVASGDLVPQARVDLLTAAYRVYRVRAHQLSLDSRPPLIADTELTRERRDVTRLWEETMAAHAP